MRKQFQRVVALGFPVGNRAWQSHDAIEVSGEFILALEQITDSKRDSGASANLKSREGPD